MINDLIWKSFINRRAFDKPVFQTLNCQQYCGHCTHLLLDTYARGSNHSAVHPLPDRLRPNAHALVSSSWLRNQIPERGIELSHID